MKRLILAFLLCPSLAFAATPVVVSSEITTDGTGGSATTIINIPGDSCSSGQLLIAIVGSSQVPEDIGFPAGWVGIVARQNNAETTEAAYRECDGTEGSTFDVTLSVGDVNSTTVSMVYKISGQDNSADPEGTITGGSATTTPDPPSLTPTGGSKTYLWITAAIQDDVSAVTSCPTNYTTNCASADNGGSGTDQLTGAFSYRGNTAASEDPGVFTFVDSDTWDALTIAVHPGVAPPTFTAGPAAGTYTQTTMPTTFTTDQTGTVYGVACADGVAVPSVAQTFAGNCGNGSAGVNSWSEAVTNAVSDGHTFSGLTAGTTYDLYFAIDGNTSDSTSVSSLLNQVTVAVPTFTAGPATGTLTSTTAQITGTPSQSGTWYGVACANGGTATIAQVKSGTCNAAAIATFSKSVTAAASDSQTFTGLTASTTYDTYHVISNAAGDSASVSLADVTTQAAAAPAFTSGPSVAAATDGYTISGTVTCTGTCTVEAVACSPGDAQPTANEIEAGQCGGGNSAILNAQENWATGVGDSFTLTGSNKPARLSIYVSATNGTTDSSVSPIVNQNRSPKSGFAIVTIASISSTGICAQTSYFTPDCAVGDTFEYEDDTNESSDCNISIGTDGDVTLTPVVGTECDGRRTFEISYEDVSSATDGLFTAPATGNFTTDDTAYINNSGPSCDPTGSLVFALTEDVAMGAIDLGVLGNCSDLDSETLSYSVTSGTIPVGTSLGGTGNKDWTGTPNTENELGASLTFQACDAASECDTFPTIVYIVNTWTVPNCIGESPSACADDIVIAAPWREQNIGLTIGTLICSAPPADLVASQNPSGAEEASAYDDIVIGISIVPVVPHLEGLTEAEAIAAIDALCD